MEQEKKDYTIEELKELHKGTLTDDVIYKLEEAFKHDFTNEEASYHAEISPATYYNYFKMSSEFREKMTKAKSFLMMVAKKNVVTAVMGKKDVEGNYIKAPSVDDSWKLLERRQKDIYSTKVETENLNVNIDTVLDELEDEYDPKELAEA